MPSKKNQSFLAKMSDNKSACAIKFGHCDRSCVKCDCDFLRNAFVRRSEKCEQTRGYGKDGEAVACVVFATVDAASEILVETWIGTLAVIDTVIHPDARAEAVAKMARCFLVAFGTRDLL